MNCPECKWPFCGGVLLGAFAIGLLWLCVVQQEKRDAEKARTERLMELIEQKFEGDGE